MFWYILFMRCKTNQKNLLFYQLHGFEMVSEINLLMQFQTSRLCSRMSGSLIYEDVFCDRGALFWSFVICFRVAPVAPGWQERTETHVIPAFLLTTARTGFQRYINMVIPAIQNLFINIHRFSKSSSAISVTFSFRTHSSAIYSDPLVLPHLLPSLSPAVHVPGTHHIFQSFKSPTMLPI